MRRSEALRLLDEQRGELAKRGVKSLDLFGSVLRDILARERPTED